MKADFFMNNQDEPILVVRPESTIEAVALQGFTQNLDWQEKFIVKTRFEHDPD